MLGIFYRDITISVEGSTAEREPEAHNIKKKNTLSTWIVSSYLLYLESLLRLLDFLITGFVCIIRAMLHMNCKLFFYLELIYMVMQSRWRDAATPLDLIYTSMLTSVNSYIKIFLFKATQAFVYEQAVLYHANVSAGNLQ